MTASLKLLDLIGRFGRNREAYLSGQYNETQLRREFLDPLFAELGWDVNNVQGYAEAYKDVIHEDAVKIGGATKAPDYCFRIGGTRKFFVEAKKPSVNIKEDISPAFQLRRYAWSAKLPLSILTDFEEFAVYDCRVKPDKADKASTARILYLTYGEYENRWPEIQSVFSREAVLKGSFDKYAETGRHKKGTAEVDDAFLKEIELWRDMLAHNIALRNPGLSQRELNFAVQRTIDRIIFLRICEDRGIEDYGRLMTLLNGANAYKRLLEIFRNADEKYNSGIFHFEKEKGRAESPDDLTPRLNIDDRQLKEILKRLYYPESPYEFSVLPADILGQVYEQFLGKVIRLTPGHQAKVEDKPEVRKAGGVYYTPTYIVDYIVKNTVGKLLEAGTPKDVSKIRILDPACGSGSFLLGAYQYLLDWHRDWYANNDPEKWAVGRNPVVYQAPSPDPQSPNWHLTTAEKKRILLNNIYGVDIDSQAVEVTKLSLLLKVLEGENNQTLSAQLRMFHERALPDLGDNIKCGNSLIGSDFYDVGAAGELPLFNDEERYRINVFDWNAEFPAIMKAGGFDAVIGNPPYGLVTDESLKRYFENIYKTTEGRFDTFELFVEQGIALSKNHRLLGYIVPSPLLSNLYARELRRYIHKNTSIEEIVNFGMNVFALPTIHTCIIILSHKPATEQYIKIRKQVNSLEQLHGEFDCIISQSDLGKNENFTFDIFIDPTTSAIIKKITKGSQSLGDIYHIRQCIKTGNDEIYVKSGLSSPGTLWKPTLRGRSIARFSIVAGNEYLKYGNWLARNWKNTTFYETPKIAVRETGNRIIATLDLENRYFLSSLYAIYPKQSDEVYLLQYILGILNSRLSTYFIKKIALDLTKGAFTKFRTNQLARLPIRTINFSDPVDKSRHDKMVSLVEQMLSLNKQLSSAKTDHEKTSLQRQIDVTDKQIDRLVYELYGLTEEEIRIVDGLDD